MAHRFDFSIPSAYSDELAEFFGIMLGDGHLTNFQVTVTLGTKEWGYAKHIVRLIQKLFNVKAKICVRKNRAKIVYFGSVDISDWLQGGGLVLNKVRAQVDAPRWLLKRRSYKESLVRGFFDTDGSIYRLRYGIQLSFTNAPKPLLTTLQSVLKTLGYKVSEISGIRFYLTRISDIERFFKEIKPENKKHVRRFKQFLHAHQKSRVGGRAVNCSRL